MCSRALRFAVKPETDFLLRSLSEKLLYKDEDFCCASERILDVFMERRLVYKVQTDTYQHYMFVTVHYDQYSCEYQYSLDEKGWRGQGCYNTW